VISSCHLWQVSNNKSIGKVVPLIKQMFPGSVSGFRRQEPDETKKDRRRCLSIAAAGRYNAPLSGNGNAEEVNHG
jgi:hypothetical protein